MSKDIKKNIASEASRCKDSVHILTAFCKKDALEFIDNNISLNITNKYLLVRFLLSDLLSGATDIEIFEYSKVRGWKLFVRFDLHAKTYLFDKKRCIIGSANLTRNGLELNDNGNYEIACLDSIDESENAKIINLFNSAIEVDESIFERMKQQYNESVVSKSVSNCWSKDIVSLMRTDICVFFPYDFPDARDYKEYLGLEIYFLDLGGDWTIDQLKKQLMTCKSYRWLKELVSKNNGEMYFGSVISELHDLFINDPKPFRKEIKQLFGNLLEWIIDLDIQEIVIDRPKYSQRIRVIK